MFELFVQPVVESNAQIFRGVASVPVENILTEPQFMTETPVDSSRPYEPQHRAAETVSLRERITRNSLVRKIGAGAAALTVALTGVAIEASPAAADSQEYTITDAAAGGYFTRNSPHTDDTPRIVGEGVCPGDKVRLICGVTDGDAVGPYSNRTWHKIVKESRPDLGEFWENDHLFNTPNKANELAPDEANCNAASNAGQPSEQHKPDIKGCYYNMKAPSLNLTFSYEGNHRYYGNAWQAAKNWTNLGTGITIKPGTGDTYIKFKDVYLNNNWYANTEVPNTPDWVGPNKTVPSQPHVPKTITIEINQRNMDSLYKRQDFYRTYAITHEIGHALGLAHANFCDRPDVSIMDSGDQGIYDRDFNTPTTYDKMELEKLYNLPIR